MRLTPDKATAAILASDVRFAHYLSARKRGLEAISGAGLALPEEEAELDVIEALLSMAIRIVEDRQRGRAA